MLAERAGGAGMVEISEDPREKKMSSQNRHVPMRALTRSVFVRVELHFNLTGANLNKMEVLQHLGSRIPMVSFQDFLDYFAPPQPDFDLNAVFRSLKFGSEPVLTSENRWSKFPTDPKDSPDSENGASSPMPEIFTKVVVTIIASSGGRLREENRTVDFLQNPNSAPESDETVTQRCSESKPDGYLVLKDQNKGISKTGKRGDILWADIALSCEYYQNDSDGDYSDVRINQEF